MPGDRSKQTWNMITIIMLLYTALFMPYKVAFIDDDSDSGLSGTLDWVVDSLFFTDIIITFFSAYEESDGSIEFRLPRIANSYIRSNLILDLIAWYLYPIYDFKIYL